MAKQMSISAIILSTIFKYRVFKKIAYDTIKSFYSVMTESSASGILKLASN